MNYDQALVSSSRFSRKHLPPPQPPDQTPRPTVPTPTPSSAVCGFVQAVAVDDGFVERRGRYCPALDIGTSFNICDNCMKGPRCVGMGCVRVVLCTRRAVYASRCVRVALCTLCVCTRRAVYASRCVRVALCTLCARR